jgi:hypothetical protein
MNELIECSDTCDNTNPPFCHCVDCTLGGITLNDDGLCSTCAKKCVICFAPNRALNEKSECPECLLAPFATCSIDCHNETSPICHCVVCGIRKTQDQDIDTCVVCQFRLALINWGEAISPPAPLNWN